MNNPIIICIDDEPMVLESLKVELKDAVGDEYFIETAEGGEEALELIEELQEGGEEVGVVISDYLMPGMKGDELLKQIHNLSPNTLKVMLTGQADLEAVGQAIKHANLYRYIAKPWQPADLRLTVVEAMRSFHHEKKLAEQHRALERANYELEQLNKAYERFVPREFLSHLNKKSITHVQLGDQIETEMTVLFSDIRNFTALSEKMTPQENFDFVNTYLKQISPAIREYNGFIDKYIGDAIMALFSGSSDDALQAAIAIQQRVARYNHRCQERPDHRCIDIGVGLHTGRVILGVVGEAERMDGTVISDAVNVAARMEGLTKLYGVSIVISDQTLFGLDQPTQYHFRFLDRVKVKGKDDPISVFEILDGNPEAVMELKLKTRTDFEKGLLHYYQQEFAEAGSYFNRVQAVDPDDEATRIYLKRINQFLEYGVPVDWEGTVALKSK